MLWLPALAAVLVGWLGLGWAVGLTADAAPWIRWTARAVALLAGGYLGWCGLLFAAQRAVLFPGTRLAVDPRRPAPAGWLPLDVTHPDGLSEGWFRPGLGCDAEHPGPLVVYAHGNGELAHEQLGWLAGYAERGVSVATLEYRGYGRSGGAPTQAGLVADLQAFVDQAARRPEVNRFQIVYHGRSLGGGVLGALHAVRPARGLILESTFASARAMAAQFRVPGFAVLDPLDTLAAVQAHPVPTLVLHGRADGVVPFTHGQRLAQAAKGRLVARDCGHNDCPQDALYWVELLGLVEQVAHPR
ncbi:MAG: alpha/beta hydrolase [Myxococcales bacterium]|nr:alpha/beta hydrolase [Myxococcales bacterium]MCB9524780.1 alpha/beta hydrolase [Myxococcales bacterium]